MAEVALKDKLFTNMVQSNLPNLKELIEKSNSQKDFLSLLKQMYPDQTNALIQIAALNMKDTFSDEDAFTTATYLALRARKAISLLTFICGDYRVTSRIINLPITLQSTKKEIAAAISKSFINNPKALGWSIRYILNSKNVPVRYQFEVFESTDSTRAKFLEEGLSWAQKEKEAFFASLDNSKTEADKYREMYANQERIQEENLWKPAFIVSEDNLK